MGTAELEFSGKVALVTGGSRGLGKAVAMALAEKGAHVFICGRKKESLDLALEDFHGRGLDVTAYPANVGNGDDVKALFEKMAERFGRLDILINNVGMNILTSSLTEVDEGLWDKIMATNLKGPFLVTAQAVRLMKKNGGGKVVNISSTAARRAAPGMGVYCVAKAGVEMLTKVLAVELASEQINVNAVAPGMIKTGFSRPFWGNEDLLKELTATIPFGRIAETGDVVGAVLFLSSGLSGFITGEVITVDGGSMA